MKINRKKFLVQSTAITTSLLLSNSNLHADEVDKMDRALRFKNLSDAISELKNLETAKNVISLKDWNLFQILNHCAQSIEYSMIGYPELKNFLFRKTVGKIAISVFTSRGYMSHDLNAPVAGAPELVKEGNLKDGFTRLYKAIEDFKNFSGELKPHLAYDNLSKEEYEKAHAMHIANHLSFVKIES